LPPSAPLVFPQIASGGGYTTEFILLGGNGSGNVTLIFFNDTGAPLRVAK